MVQAFVDSIQITSWRTSKSIHPSELWLRSVVLYLPRQMLFFMLTVDPD